jgi:heme-degrading monooxygenase HmoA
MLVFLSARRLKPGSWEQFRRAWDPGGDKPPGFQRAYHARNIRDEDEVISFGIFDIDRDHDAISSVRGEEQAELARQDAMAAFVKNVPLEGVYEVIEEIKP